MPEWSGRTSTILCTAHATWTLSKPAADWPAIRYNFRVRRSPIMRAGRPGEGIDGETPRCCGDIRACSEEEILELARSLDTDGDGLSNADDNVPFVPNSDQADSRLATGSATSGS